MKWGLFIAFVVFATTWGRATPPAAPAALAVPAVSVDSQIESTLLRAATGLHPEALRQALASWKALRSTGVLRRPLLSVIDYALPSTEKRLWVFDVEAGRVLFHELVAHGRNSGDNIAERFSNVEGSFMTSLGAFVTGSSYNGRNGYSMRLLGAEPNLNDMAEARAIVIHGAPYVDEAVVRTLGRLGRSHGCPALRPAIARTLIDEIRDGTVVYAWHPSIAPGDTPSGPDLTANATSLSTP